MKPPPAYYVSLLRQALSDPAIQQQGLEDALRRQDRKAILNMPVSVCVEHYSRNYYGKNDVPFHDLAHLFVADLANEEHPMDYAWAQKRSPLYVAGFESEFPALACQAVFSHYRGNWTEEDIDRLADESSIAARAFNDEVQENALNQISFQQPSHAYPPLRQGIERYLAGSLSHPWEPEEGELQWHIRRAIAFCDAMHQKYLAYPADMKEAELLSKPLRDFFVPTLTTSPYDEQLRQQRQALHHRQYRTPNGHTK